MKACFGGARWPKAEMSKTAKNRRKINVFGRFLEATSLEKACKVAFWRSSCGLEGLKTASWMTSWLQDGLERAKSSPRWPKMAPRSGQKGDDHHRVNPRAGGARPSQRIKDLQD